MNDKEKKDTSKFLSLVLRHQPELIGIELDANGWADVSKLIECAAAKQVVFTLDELKEIVASNDKKRFAFNEDETKIRASQGHSVDIDLDLEEKEPPEILYHGTVEKFLNSILQTGLIKGSRQHVHLSKDIATAMKVGERRGKPVILIIDSAAMYKDGFKFYRSANGVCPETLCENSDSQ